MPLKARTPDGSVTPDSLPLAVLTGSEIAAGVVTADAATTAAVMARVSRVFMRVYRLCPLSCCCLARSARDALM